MSVDAYQVDPLITVARVTRVGDVVVNIESANEAWLGDAEGDGFFYFVQSPDREGGGAVIGLRYLPGEGLFEQPPLGEESDGKLLG